MTLDVILNIAWLLVGLLALALLQAHELKGKSQIFCCVGVVLVVATLFPVISASDDLIRMEHLERVHQSRRQQDTSTSGHKRTNDTLVRLYEAMDSPLETAPVRISFSESFSFLFIPLCETYAWRGAIAPSGRSPPVRLA